MKHVIAGLAIVVVASLVLAPANSFAAQAKGKSTGTVSAVGADSVTVKVAGKDMTFKVDAKTDVIATGAGTKTKEAKKEGMKGPKFSEVVTSQRPALPGPAPLSVG